MWREGRVLACPVCSVFAGFRRGNKVGCEETNLSKSVLSPSCEIDAVELGGGNKR